MHFLLHTSFSFLDGNKRQSSILHDSYWYFFYSRSVRKNYFFALEIGLGHNICVHTYIFHYLTVLFNFPNAILFNSFYNKHNAFEHGHYNTTHMNCIWYPHIHSQTIITYSFFRCMPLCCSSCILRDHLTQCNLTFFHFFFYNVKFKPLFQASFNTHVSNAWYNQFTFSSFAF